MTRFDSRLLKLYKDASLGYRVYTFIRCAVCPFMEIERYVPKEGKILDSGGGHGIFANLLAISSRDRHVIGMDIMQDKIRIANSTLSGRKNIEFMAGDLEKSLSVEGVKCFILMDILCYIPLADKKKLLKKIYDKLPDNGTLIIKSIHEHPRFKYYWTLFHMATIDKLMHRSFAKNSYFLKRREYADLLKEIGFEVEFKDVSKGYPYSHCLYICVRKDR